MSGNEAVEALGDLLVERLACAMVANGPCGPSNASVNPLDYAILESRFGRGTRGSGVLVVHTPWTMLHIRPARDVPTDCIRWEPRT